MVAIMPSFISSLTTTTPFKFISCANSVTRIASGIATSCTALSVGRAKPCVFAPSGSFNTFCRRRPRESRPSLSINASTFLILCVRFLPRVLGANLLRVFFFSGRSSSLAGAGASCRRPRTTGLSSADGAGAAAVLTLSTRAWSAFFAANAASCATLS